MRPVSPRTFLLATAGVLCLAASLLSPPILSNFLLHFGTIRPSAFVATLWGVCASFVLCAGVLVLVAQDAADAENLLQWARHRFLAIVSVGVVGVLLSLAVVAWIALAVDIASRAVLLGLFVFGLLFLATGILLVGLPRSPFLCAFSLSTALRALLYTAILSGSGLLTAKLVTTGYNAARNHVDIIADLDRRHPLYQEVQNVRSSQGLDARGPTLSTTSRTGHLRTPTRVSSVLHLPA